LDGRTLMYLASDPDGSGPWLYSVDVQRRIPHRLTSGLDRYTSLAASADGRRLVVTLASPKRTLWRLRIADSPTTASAATPISLTTSTGSSPRLGPKLSSIGYCDWYGREYLEARQRNCNRVVAWSGRASHWRPRNRPMDGLSHSRSGNAGGRSYT